MKIAISEKLTLVTTLTKQEVYEALTSNTQPNQKISFGSPKSINYKKFEGTVSENYFRIKRIINYRNSFLPEITGQVTQKPNGSEITVKLMPVGFVIAFMSLWVGGLLFGSIAIIIGSFVEGGPIAVCLLPLLMAIAGYTMSKIGFAAESKNSKRELIEILKATEKQN